MTCCYKNRYKKLKEEWKIESIYEASQKLGIKKDEIKQTMIRKKKTIIAGALVLVALAFIGNLYYLGSFYGGIGVDDFEFIKQFPM